jgi:hypothetical protein
VELIVPTSVLPPAIPLTSQVTESSVTLAALAVNVCVPDPATTLAAPGHTATTGSGVVNEQDLSAAFVGAIDVVLVGLNTTSAVSTLPASSVTVTRTLPYPHDGAVAVAVALVAFDNVIACFPVLAH